MLLNLNTFVQQVNLLSMIPVTSNSYQPDHQAAPAQGHPLHVAKYNPSRGRGSLVSPPVLLSEQE